MLRQLNSIVTILVDIQNALYKNYKLQSLIQTCVQLEHRYGEQLFSCHCDAFRAHLMMKYLTSIDVNKKSIVVTVKCIGLILR